jgi:hypothetical protein
MCINIVAKIQYEKEKKEKKWVGGHFKEKGPLKTEALLCR